MPCNRVLIGLVAVCALTFASAANASVDPDQTRVPSPAGDGWQVLGAGNGGKTATAAASASQAGATAPAAFGSLAAGTALSASTDVKTIVLPGAGTAPPATLSLSIAPQDLNLRNALDRWLQTQGWQLAWKIDDDLPVEFNASFSGDFDGLLTQVMRATNHMRTPARVCEHTNNVVRVIARAANCKD
ncbi:toxin co-regulated pilus biosynthesis Q family protein [Paraburkholderia bannensis]|uniref:toxin co-regulated pilus biosynthesis Q family protein n=1 Tax=Paraburkholderia bannensis TaxID=765414 RepID=UPI0005A7FC77|nr:toxin co-regulated pilus biosynthesis Q family protein [Paraburkholderia bannensis]